MFLLCRPLPIQLMCKDTILIPKVPLMLTPLYGYFAPSIAVHLRWPLPHLIDSHLKTSLLMNSVGIGKVELSPNLACYMSKKCETGFPTHVGNCLVLVLYIRASPHVETGNPIPELHRKKEWMFKHSCCLWCNSLFV